MTIEFQSDIVHVIRALLTEYRKRHNLSQDELAAILGIHRRQVARLESEKGLVDLKRIEQAFALMDEQLQVRLAPKSAKTNMLPVEDQILQLFAEGKLDKAEPLLKTIRTWQYPLSQAMSRCKRDMAIALQHHFKGNAARGAAYLNNTIMGLSLARFTKEAEQVMEMYQGIIRKAEQL